MNADWKKSIRWAGVLMLLGIMGLFAGAKSLVVLIPMAMVVWFEVRPALRRDKD